MARARALVDVDDRRILGITGPPGAGKSTMARRLVDVLGATAVLLGMDGYHLAQAELERRGCAERKGAPDTFDAAGYVALLHRLRAPAAGTVYAPEFRRAIEEPIAGAIAVPPHVPPSSSPKVTTCCSTLHHGRRSAGCWMRCGFSHPTSRPVARGSLPATAGTAVPRSRRPSALPAVTSATPA